MAQTKPLASQVKNDSAVSGTTTTDALNTVNNTLKGGTAGQVLTSTGGSNPTWAAATSPTTLTGDITGAGTGTVATTLANSGVTAGTYNSVTVDAKGRVTAGSTVVAGAVGGGSDKIFYENATNMTSSYTLTAGKNAAMVGPLTMNNGVTITVPSGRRLVIL